MGCPQGAEAHGPNPPYPGERSGARVGVTLPAAMLVLAHGVEVASEKKLEKLHVPRVISRGGLRQRSSPYSHMLFFSFPYVL